MNDPIPTVSSFEKFFVRWLAFFRRDFLHETSYKLQTVFKLLSVFFTLLTFYFLARIVGGEETRDHLDPYGSDYFTFAIVGLSFLGLFNAGIINFSASIRQQLAIGVLEAVATAPLRSFEVLLYSMGWPLGFELVKTFFYLLLATLAFGAEIRIVDPGLLLATLALSLAVFGSLGIISASLIVYFKKGDPIAWIISSFTTLVGGVLFPVSLLPDWLLFLGRLIPVTYSLDALRASLIPSAQLQQTGEALVALLIFAVILIPTALWSATLVFEKARQNGNLGLY